MKPKKTSGFTLVEVMIVMAIIGLLAAIVIPNFIRARNKVIWDSENERMIASIHQQLSTGLSTAYITNNWYYFRDSKDPDIGTMISKFMRQMSQTNNTMPSIVCSIECDKGRIVQTINPRIYMLTQRAGLTNGYLVAFRPLVPSANGLEVEASSQ